MLSQDAPAAHPAAAMDYPAEIYRLNLTYLIAARDALLNCARILAGCARGREAALAARMHALQHLLGGEDAGAAA